MRILDRARVGMPKWLATASALWHARCANFLSSHEKKLRHEGQKRHTLASWLE